MTRQTISTARSAFVCRLLVAMAALALLTGGNRALAAEGEFTIDPIPVQWYRGDPLAPSVTVRYDGRVLDEEDYTVTYVGNDASSDCASVVVQSDFGTATQQFRITRGENPVPDDRFGLVHESGFFHGAGYVWGDTGDWYDGWWYNTTPTGTSIGGTGAGISESDSYYGEGWIRYSSGSWPGHTPRNQWIYEDGLWCYFGDDHTLQKEQRSCPITGWYLSYEGWRYVEHDGTWPTPGWRKLDGKWYFFGQEGRTQRWAQWGDGWYFMPCDDDESWTDCTYITGWKYIDRGTYDSRLKGQTDLYYFDASGRMATGWRLLSRYGWRNAWFYFGASGKAAEGWKQIKGSWYYFDKLSHELATNQWVGDWHVNADGVWDASR